MKEQVHASAPKQVPAPPPVNRAVKPSIPAKPAALPVAPMPQNGTPGLQPTDQRRPSFEARVSPFSTPPSSDESPDNTPPTAAAITKSLQEKATPATATSQPSASTEPSQSIDPRSLGFARTPTAPIRKDPRTLGLSNAEPQRPRRESPGPARANTVSDRSAARDARDVGFSAPARSQQPRHVSENIPNFPPQNVQPQQSKTQTAMRDPRNLGFGITKQTIESVAEEPGPDLPARHVVKAPPPRPPEESKYAPRGTRQTSPVPDRLSKPPPKPTISRVPTAPADANFPPPPKRHTGESEIMAPLSHPATYPRSGPVVSTGDDSDEADEQDELPANPRSDYPDATQANRRPPYFRQGLREIAVKSDSRTFAVCGKYLCVTGYSTRVFDVSTGEQTTGANHGETVKATAVSFKPAVKLEDEGSRLWIGDSAGILQELDVATHSVIAESHAHNRREIVQILRHGKDLWTLDDDGKLFVWPADETGVPNLKYRHLSHKVPKGHTFSLVVQDKLWLATGREIRIYKPGNEASFTPLNAITSQPGGDITSGTFTEDNGGRVYFGHTDGKVTIYSIKDFSCVRNVKVSDYKINGLVVLGNNLWAAYKTGKIYVYDISQWPWKVQKDWRGHDGPIAGLVLDASAFWTLNRLQVTSIGHDGHARFWDGTLEEDWIENTMHEQDVHYCTFRDVRAAVITWNVGASSPYDLRSDFIAEAIDPRDPVELLVFGFQEVVDLEDRAVTAKSLFGFGKKKDQDSTEQHQSRVYREWRDYLSKAISRFTYGKVAYSELHTSSLIGLFQCIFIRQDQRATLQGVNAANVKCGMKGHYGNKGALVTRFVLDDSTLCFINCHLAAGQTQTSHRNNDVATILEAENLPPERDPDTRMSLYVGGGDGSQILDHEICLLNGDLNYRIDAIPRDTVVNMIRRGEMAKLLDRDQMMISRRRVAGFRLASFVEMPITFAPTYKYDVGTDNYDSSDKKRAPAWCDRILYRGPGRIKQIDYRRHEVRVSDHRPVSGMFKLRIKTIDPRRRSKVKDDCYARFAEVKKTLAERASQRYLVNELGLDEREAKKLIVGV